MVEKKEQTLGLEAIKYLGDIQAKKYEVLNQVMAAMAKNTEPTCECECKGGGAGASSGA